MSEFENEKPKNVKRKVYVTLTTIPSRFLHIRQCLASLLNQSLKPDEVVLSLPMESKREPTTGDPYNVTDELLNEFKKNGITIWRTKKDYGPATKLLGLLEREIPKQLPPDKEALIVTVDDDKIYHPDTVKCLVQGWERNQKCVVARKGCVLVQLSKKSEIYMRNTKHFDSINRYHELVFKGCDLTKDMDVSVILGTGGVLYRASYFDEYIFDYSKKDESFPSKEIFFTDDLYISGYLGVMGVTKRVICFDKNNVTEQFDKNDKLKRAAVIDIDSESRKINPLIDINGKNNIWLRIVLDYYNRALVRSIREQKQLGISYK